MKKLLALLFALTMVLALAACGGAAETEEPAEAEETETTEAAEAEEDTEEAAEAEEPAGEEEAETEAEPAGDADFDSVSIAIILSGSINDNGFGGHLCVHFLRDMAEARKNDPNYGVNNQVMLRNAWKTLTGETVN